MNVPIAFASRTADINYSTTEQELSAIIWVTKYFSPYTRIYGIKIKIVTAHKPLKWLFNIKDPGSGLIRWRIELEDFYYEIVCEAGKINVNTDALSQIQIEQIIQKNDDHK